MSRYKSTGTLLESELVRMKELLYGRTLSENLSLNKKPLITEKISVVRGPVRTGNYNIDFGTVANSEAALAKVRNYLENIERNGSMFELNNVNNPNPYANLGWRTSADFITAVESGLSQVSTPQEITQTVMRYVDSFNAQDRAKWDTEVINTTKNLYTSGLKNPTNEFHIDVETNMQGFLQETAEAALLLNPNMTKLDLDELIDITAETFSADLDSMIPGASANFQDIPKLVKDHMDNVRQTDNPDYEPTGETGIRDYYDALMKLSNIDALRIKELLSEIRVLWKAGRRGFDPDANFANTQRMVDDIATKNLSPEQIRARILRIQENLSATLRDEMGMVDEFKDELKRVETAINNSSIPKSTKDDILKQLREKTRHNVMGSVKERYNWVDEFIEDISISQEGKTNPDGNGWNRFEERYLGKEKGLEGKYSTDGVFKNAVIRILNLTIIGQWRTFPEIKYDTARIQSGTWRMRYLKTYLWMMAIKFLILPMLGGFFEYWSLSTECAKVKDYNKRHPETPVTIPPDIAEFCNTKGRMERFKISVWNNWKDSFSRFLELVSDDNEGNWFAGMDDRSKKDFGGLLNEIENFLDVFNPLSTSIDEIWNYATDPETFDKWVAETANAAQKVNEKVSKTKEQVSEELEKLQDETLSPEEMVIKTKDRGHIESSFNRWTEDGDKSSDGFKYIDKNLRWDPDADSYYLEDPANSMVKYYIDNDNDPSKSFYIKGNGNTWQRKQFGDFVTYINNRLNSAVPEGPTNDSGPRNVQDSIIKKIKNIIMEEMTGKKFGDDNFKHWKDTFTFKSVDEKNPGQYKDVKINMEDVMDRIDHYRKKYDEDDAFVRAVIDTHEDVVKVMFTKDLAHLQENHKPTGLAIILQQIKESRGEMEIWSVARPANGNWFLVKGDYTSNQLANMDLEKKEPQPKEKEVDSRTEDDLKKKEELAIHNLKNNEKGDTQDLPKQVRDKINEKLSNGWTTEDPFFAFEKFYEVSEINSVFNDKIKIYKLKPSEDFFKTLVRESASLRVSRGFCKSLNQVKNQTGLVERQQKVLNHFIEKCENKFGNEPIKKYRQPRFND
jgi:hypothetical protein